jgi:hypothetical protein
MIESLIERIDAADDRGNGKAMSEMLDDMPLLILCGNSASTKSERHACGRSLSI